MICAENELCTWPSDSCITVLRMKSSDYKCRKKEWNELKKLSTHGDGIHRCLASSFVNLVSIEEKCNGDQLDVCAVPISPWEQDSVTSLSLCSEDGYVEPHRSLSSTQIELDSDHTNFEKSCKLVLKKSTSSPSLFDKKKSEESKINLSDEELSDAPSGSRRHITYSYSEGFQIRDNSLLEEKQEQEDASHIALLASSKADQQLNDDSINDQQFPNESSELLDAREESGTSVSPIFSLIRSCFPFLFRSRVLKN